MSELLRRAAFPGIDGATVRVDPATEPAGLGGVGWHWISFGAHELVPGATVSRSGDDQEVGVLVLEGSVRLRAGQPRLCLGASGTGQAEVGARRGGTEFHHRMVSLGSSDDAPAIDQVVQPPL
jgi:5-deoxy-D-glucuronate isomerase